MEEKLDGADTPSGGASSSPPSPSRSGYSEHDHTSRVNAKRDAISCIGALGSGPLRHLQLGDLSRQPGGFLEDGLRVQAWSLALELPAASLHDSEQHDKPEQQPSPQASDWPSLPEHKDENQVRLDVDRSFVYYPHGLSPDRSQALKNDLFDIITATLRRYPKLCYFQGFHDIVQVLLLVLGKDRAFDAVVSVSLTRLRDFMLPSLSTSLVHLELLPAILTAADPPLAVHISSTRPFFALGATLTLFAHEVESYADIARLFDYLLTNEAVSAIYLFASIILNRREELLQVPEDEPEMLHFKLSKLPKPIDLDKMVMEASNLLRLHPPESLPHRAWSKISEYSVLKTTRGGTQLTVQQASEFFDKQLKEMAAVERRKSFLAALYSWRRPVGGIAVAVLVGVLSVWIQRSPTPMPQHVSSLLSAFPRFVAAIKRVRWSA